MAVKITKDNVGRLVESVKELTGRVTVVGIPAKTNEREDAPFGNAAIGYINETGDPERNIPPRPHLVPGVRAASDVCARALQRAGKAALGGDKAQVSAGFEAAGLAAVSSVRNTIAAVIPPPLAPRTLGARKKRGNEGETPLIDTGAYNQAITYEVREKK